MVPNLIYYSHPNKYLEEHIFGVLKKSQKYVSLPWVNMAILFHDIGKLNPFFQRKLINNIDSGYSNHSYLSVLSFYTYCMANQHKIKEIFHAESTDDLRIKIIQTTSLIAYHHGNLPNLNEMLSQKELNCAIDFLENHKLPLFDFCEQKLNLSTEKHIDFNYEEMLFLRISKYIRNIHEEIWKKNALNYFMNTQLGFASLIHADKRDAGNNNYSQFEEKIGGSVQSIKKNLEELFNKFNQTKNITELNQTRTEIRIEAETNIQPLLNSGNRIYTLTAPTGSGKTLTLLSLAKKIQEIKGDYGVIYTLPFLSITEQVENILDELEINYLPFNSKSTNPELEKLQVKYENNPSSDNFKKLIQQCFSDESFDHPFIITTFVQFFETLLSNKNATLIKLPNFSKRIFLIDEFQALPPRLYVFFSAWLYKFCEKYDSYAILSTATMPKFNFPKKEYLDSDYDPRKLFLDYQPPQELISPNKYFSKDIFSRFQINIIDNNNFKLADLAEHINKQVSSCLVILNTIAETRSLFKILSEKRLCPIFLLNTHFIPDDRSQIILETKTALANNEKVILISTQLIEAGVDIDFPIVYRDLCPLPNLVQSAGRCNRNKKKEMGEVFFFNLRKNSGKSSAEIIYGKDFSEFLIFCRNNIKDGILEKDIFPIQSLFYEYIKGNLSIGEFNYETNKKANMIKCINGAQFELLGKFQLINKSVFGNEYRYYIPKNEEDISYDELINIMNNNYEIQTFDEYKRYKILISSKLKELSRRIITVRLRATDTPPLYSNNEEYFGIRVLADLSKYNKSEGLSINIENQFI